MISINIYSAKNINIISIIISIIIILFLNLFINNFLNLNSSQIDNEKIISENKIVDEQIQENSNQEFQENLGDWYIEIKSINLKAPIKETTNMNILNKYIGHFEETAVNSGNVGLAAHNRGYEKNYFENLKNIKKGDEIKYKYNNFEKIYVVDKIKIIEETDWSYLENTKENKITLITCIENKPKYRLCVQSVEK